MEWLLSANRQGACGLTQEPAQVRAKLEGAEQRLSNARCEVLEVNEASRGALSKLREAAARDRRKAAALIKEDPKTGPRRIARSAARRVKP